MVGSLEFHFLMPSNRENKHAGEIIIEITPRAVLTNDDFQNQLSSVSRAMEHRTTENWRNSSAAEKKLG